MNRLSVSALMIALSGLILGGFLTRAWYLHEIDGLHLQHAQEQQATLMAQSARLKAATQRGDDLEYRLSNVLAQANKTTKERDDALRNSTAGRFCLDFGTVRLLNSAGSGAGALPQATGGADAADGAAASDTDVALWINSAIAQYEVCRARLGALVDFYLPAGRQDEGDKNE